MNPSFVPARRWTQFFTTLMLLIVGLQSPSLHSFVENEKSELLENIPIEILRETAFEIVNESVESQTLLYAHIEAEALRFYDIHKNNLKLNRNVWKKIVRNMVLSMQELKLGIQAVKRFSKPATRTLVATTIITNILPFILYALDQTLLAGIVTIVQWEFVVPPLHIVIMRYNKYRGRIYEYGKENYKEAVALRRKLIGMSERTRLLTLIDEKISHDLSNSGVKWITISSKTMSENPLLGQSVSIPELIEIVKKIPQGPELLEELRESYSLRSVYAMELWHIIRSDSVASEELKNILRQRIPKTNDGALLKLTRQLTLSRDLNRALNLAEDKVLKAISNARYYASREERKELKELAQQVSSVRQRLFNTIDSVELHLLVSKVTLQESYFRLDDLIDFANDLYLRLHKAIPLIESLKDDRLMNTQKILKALNFENPMDKIKSNSECNILFYNFMVERI